MATPKETTTTAPADKGVIEKRPRKPKATVTIPATQAKALAKVLGNYADDLAAKGDNAGAIKYATQANALDIAARYGTKTEG